MPQSSSTTVEIFSALGRRSNLVKHFRQRTKKRATTNPIRSGNRNHLDDVRREAKETPKKRKQKRKRTRPFSPTPTAPAATWWWPCATCCRAGSNARRGRRRPSPFPPHWNCRFDGNKQQKINQQKQKKTIQKRDS